MSSIPQIVLPCIGKEIIIKKSSREFRVFSINEQKQLCTYLCKHMSYKTWEFLYASTQDFVSEKYVPFAGITLKRRLSADWLRFLCRTPNDAKPF